MTAVYAVATVAGLGGLVAWALLRGVRPEGGDARFDPERRFGVRGRMVVAGVTGFGLAGMSSTFAGWGSGAAAAAAVVGAAVVALLSRSLGPEHG